MYLTQNVWFTCLHNLLSKHTWLVTSAQTYVGLRAKCPVLSSYNKNCYGPTSLAKLQYQISSKFCSYVLELFHAHNGSFNDQSAKVRQRLKTRPKHATFLSRWTSVFFFFFLSGPRAYAPDAPQPYRLIVLP